MEVDELRPTPEEWLRFWDALDRARIWHWEPRYETAGVCDGTYWHVTAERGGRRVESAGDEDLRTETDPEARRGLRAEKDRLGIEAEQLGC